MAVLVNAIVHLRPENPPAKAAGYVYLVNGVLPIAPPLRDPRLDAVLVLEPRDEAAMEPSAGAAPGGGGDTPGAASGAAPTVAPPPVEVQIYGARLIPEVIIAAPGAQVIFRNDDRRALTLFCQQTKELFPSAPLPPGSRLAITPPSAGQFDLRSVEYPHLRATLLAPRGAASRLEWSPLGEVGMARLDVPEGKYQARLFFLHRYVAVQDVTVAATEKTRGPGQAEAQGQAKPSEFVLHAVWPATSAPAVASPSP